MRQTMEDSEMATVVKLDIPENASDETIKQIAKKNRFNGAYATTICRKCGMFISNPNGNCEKAKIVDSCKFCTNNIM
jgi:hypothetical protein